MSSIKEATESAMSFAREALGPERILDLCLEEVESTTVDDKEAWLVTLSMFSSAGAATLARAIGGKGSRVYKIFTVLKADGEVTAMKNREPAE
jgi:hypothetical protein